MSRYQVDTAQHRIAIGWDNAMQTLFFQVYDLEPLREMEKLEDLYRHMAVSCRKDSLLDQIAALEADCQPICWRGGTHSEIRSIGHLRVLMERYVDLPDSIALRLRDDMAGAAPLGPLQRFIRGVMNRVNRRDQQA